MITNQHFPKAVCWTHQDIIEFIQLIHAEPAIWKQNSEGHQIMTLVQQAWIRVQSKLSLKCSIAELKRKKNVIFSQYRANLNQIEEAQREGKDFKITWSGFEIMHKHFSSLYDGDGNQNTDGSSELNNDSDDQDATNSKESSFCESRNGSTGWTHSAILEFLELIHNENAIWNTQCEEHLHNRLFKEAWIRLQNNFSLKCTMGELKDKKNSLFTQYRHILKKLRKAERKDVPFKTSWFAFETMQRYFNTLYDGRLSSDGSSEEILSNDSDEQDATNSKESSFCESRNGSTKWSRTAVTEFLVLLHNENAIWNTQCEEHWNKPLVKKAWIRLQNKFSFKYTIEELKAKKNSLFTQYRDTLKKYTKAERKNIRYKTSWFAFETMQRYFNSLYDGRLSIDKKTKSDTEKYYYSNKRTNVQNRKYKWTRSYVFQFLGLLKTENALWNYHSIEHQSHALKNAAWRRLQKKFILKSSLSQLKNKKNSLFTQYRSVLRRMRQEEGNNANYVPNWYAFKIMHSYFGSLYENGQDINDDFETNTSISEAEPKELETTATRSISDTEIKSDNEEFSGNAKKRHKTKNSQEMPDSPRNIETSDPPRIIEIQDALQNIETSESTQDLKKPDIKTGEPFLEMNSIKTQKECDAEIDLYGRLLAEKLKKFDDHRRRTLIKEIDQLVCKYTTTVKATKSEDPLSSI